MDPKVRAHLVRWAAWLIPVGLLAFFIPIGYYTAAPGPCVQCHGTADDPFVSEASSHAGVECVECHVGETLIERGVFGYYQAFGMRVRFVSTHDTPISRVRDSACTACHDSLAGVVESRGLRIRHDACGEGQACVSCHSAVAHPDEVRWPTSYAMERCLSCHGVREVSRECESCHMGRIDRAVPSTGTFPVTHGPNWRRTHGMGEMSTCAACHRDDFCTECHGPGVPHAGRFISQHGGVARSAEAGCLDCHEQDFCDACHGYEMPHPREFVVEHSTIFVTDGEAGCRYCHDQADCVVCHETHAHPGGAGPLEPIRGDDRR
jgi:hypothetical protein